MLPNYNDSGFRRGYIHGMNNILDEINRGVEYGKLCEYVNYMNNRWRFKNTNAISIPISYGEFYYRWCFEQVLFGYMLLDNQKIQEIEEKCQGYEFVSPNYFIYDLILEIRKEGQPVDLISLRDKLKEYDLYGNTGSKLEDIVLLVDNVSGNSEQLERALTYICKYCGKE